MNIEELKNKIDEKEKELLKLKEELKRINNYETMVIIDTTTNIKKYDIIKKEIKEICENLKGLEELGIKKLAYEIKQNKEAFYLYFEWEGNEIDVAELETFFRNNNNVLKFLIIKQEV